MNRIQEPVTCAVWGDHEALRWGLCALLKHGGINVVGHTQADEHAIAMAQLKRPQVAVLDMDASGSTAATVSRRVLESPNTPALIIYSEGNNMELLASVIEAGALGVVAKRSPAAELVRAVRLASRGERYVDGTVAAALLDQRRANRFLSDRETQVLQLLANGATTEQAATDLFLSPATIRSYAESAIGKFGAQNRVQAVAEAIRRELIA